MNIYSQSDSSCRNFHRSESAKEINQLLCGMGNTLVHAGNDLKKKNEHAVNNIMGRMDLSEGGGGLCVVGTYSKCQRWKAAFG